MKCRTLVLVGASGFALLVSARSATAQDVMKVAPNHYKILKENASVRVVENTLATGEKGAMHSHPAGWYYVTKPGKMKIVFADGKTETWDAKLGESGRLDGEGPHTSENTGETTLAYVLVEVKGAKPANSKANPAAKVPTKK